MPRRICPRCGSRNTASILWGMPAMDDELQKKLDNKEMILGGCCITGNDPSHHCNACKKKLGVPTQEKERQTIKVHFYIGGYFDGYPKITLIKTPEGALAEYIPPPISEDKPSSRKMSADEWSHFVHDLYRCHITDWKRRYVDPDTLDGTQW